MLLLAANWQHKQASVHVRMSACVPEGCFSGCSSDSQASFKDSFPSAASVVDAAAGAVAHKP